MKEYTQATDFANRLDFLLISINFTKGNLCIKAFLVYPQKKNK